jgi:molecular chaperone GrpE
VTSSSQPVDSDRDVTEPGTEPGTEARTDDAQIEASEQFESDMAFDPAVDPRTDVERERDEYLDALRRLQADFENYKKRVARQFEDLSSRGVTTLVEKLLVVLDALDLAEEHLLAERSPDGTLTAETKALVQARALLVDTLSKEGLEPLGVAGQPFDPTVHDAVAHSEGDDGPIVDEVLRTGYQWRGQVLRPAMVKVRG